MMLTRPALALLAALTAAGCTPTTTAAPAEAGAPAAAGSEPRFVEEGTADGSADIQLGQPNHLSNMRDAGIWVDPQGCDHWIIDEGVEGYMSARLDPYGNPVCAGIAPPTVAVGRFRRGT